MDVSINENEVNKMTLAEKIINLRKQKGWSQEELAEKLDVTRQSVSKWESAQSTPDIAKILQISELFGVTTDYLLKDNEEETEKECAPKSAEENADDGIRKVGREEAETYLSASRAAAWKIALGVFLCIVSPICLIILSVAAETGAASSLSVSMASLIGLVVFFIMIAAAVAIFMLYGLPLSKFDYMEKEAIKLSGEAKTAIEAEKNAAEKGYIRKNTLGVLLCIVGVVLLIICSFAENELLAAIGCGVLLLLVACGVYSFVSAGVPWGAMQKMLEEGEYNRKNKTASKKLEAVSGAYWPLVTLLYLAYSFATHDWHITWVIWPIAAVVFGVIEAIFAVSDKSEKDK